MIEWMRGIALASLAFYFLFDYFDARRVSDEREELIKLKSLELAHKASLGMLTLLAFVYAAYPGVDAQLMILGMIAAALYGEIAAKLYYRAKL